MNKILFKLIEGKGKFFLNGDLKNGEIVNPGALPIEWTYRFTELKDGDIFDLPKFTGFTVISNQAKCDYCKIDCLQNLKGIPCKAPKAIRLLPEKPVQKEESQEDDKDDWDALGNEINKRMVLDDAFGVHPILTLIRQAKLFTIKRKET